MVITKRFLGRWGAFSAVPWILLLVAVFVWWPSLYILAPFLFPFSAYGGPVEDWTMLADRKLGVPIDIVYSLIVGLLATVFGYSRSLPQAVGIFVMLLAVLSVAIHVLLNAMGFTYWYDSP